MTKQAIEKRKLGRICRAHTNIALIKYWGKADKDLIIPNNNSLSLTLDAFYTDTQVVFDPDLDQDQLWLDGNQVRGSALTKAKVILDLVRGHGQLDWPAKITSHNQVATAAGLASSASGLAALAGASADALDLDLSQADLSRLARKGSGSACRSIFGGFVEWERGHDDATSLAKPIDLAQWDIAMLFVIVSDRPKAISSSQGMQLTQETSDFYQAWLDSLDQDLAGIKVAIQAQDLDQVGAIAERNALKMHATNLAAKPPFTYWTKESLALMQEVWDRRMAGQSLYFTMDAGPNVKVIGREADLKAFKADLSQDWPDKQVVLAKPGPGLAFIDGPLN